jgi:hypothetical protein
VPELGGGLGAPVSQAHLEARIAEQAAADAASYVPKPAGGTTAGYVPTVQGDGSIAYAPVGGAVIDGGSP